MRSEHTLKPCHPEEPGRAVRRGIRSLVWPFLLLLVVVAPGCEDLPAAPNIPPTAAFIYNPVSPITAGETPVSFNAVGSLDSDGSIVSYTWSFGDGSPDETASIPTVSHVFRNTPATCIEVVYSTLLTVTDDKGGTGTASQQVRVIEAPAPGSAQCR